MYIITQKSEFERIIRMNDIKELNIKFYLKKYFKRKKKFHFFQIYLENIDMNT